MTGDGLLTMRECAEMAGLPIRRMPKRAFHGLARAMWAARASEAPPGQLRFAEHPWVASNEKVKETLGWQPKHSSRETFEATMRPRRHARQRYPGRARAVSQSGERQLDRLEVAVTSQRRR